MYIDRLDKTKVWRHHCWGSNLLSAFVKQIPAITAMHFTLLPGTFGSFGQNGWRRLRNWATSLVGEQSLQRGRLWWGDVSLEGFHTYLRYDSIRFEKCALFNQQVIKGHYEYEVMFFWNVYILVRGVLLVLTLMLQDGLITFEEFLRVLENANMEKICMKFTIWVEIFNKSNLVIFIAAPLFQPPNQKRTVLAPQVLK